MGLKSAIIRASRLSHQIRVTRKEVYRTSGGREFIVEFCEGTLTREGRTHTFLFVRFRTNGRTILGDTRRFLRDVYRVIDSLGARFQNA